MKIAVVGATGMIGSTLTRELLARGDAITAIARNPEKLESVPNLARVRADIMNMDELATAVAGHDVVVCAHSPGGAMGAQVYKDIIEAGWRIKRVFARVNGRYLMVVGGASSLWGPTGHQMFEDPAWPKWFWNCASPAHLRHLRGFTKIEAFEELALAREKILADSSLDPYSDWQEPHLQEFLAKIASNHEKGEGGRAQLELFAGDNSLRWSYVSPPWFLRPGPRTGAYRVTIDALPLDGDKPAGISVADLCVAIADELHAQVLVNKHWSAATAAVQAT